MATPNSRTSLIADASTERVEDLVGLVRRGAVRVPNFQRGLRWESNDVLALFDSLYNGYPIGSLLLRKGKAQADRIHIGPLSVDAPETHDALWVIDGQQRLTALTAGLARPSPIPKTPEDPYVVYFDSAAQKFKAPSRDANIPNTWVPVAQLLDSSGLTEWVFNWSRGSDPTLRRAVFSAGTRIREYRVPLYIVETDDEQLLRDIFYRINNYGRSLRWDEVHDALFGRAGDKPSTLVELTEELATLGMGRPEESQILPCLVAFRGLDVTRSIADHYQKDRDVLKSTVQEALPALRTTLSFLKRSGEIPHLRFLPRSTPLPILTRFFAVYPEPRARTQQLLTRWLWRTILAANFYDERTLLRHGVSLIDGNNEEQTVQRLLKLIPNQPPTPFTLPTRFDARGADSRLALLGLASLKPVHLDSLKPIEVADLIETEDVEAFRKIIPSSDPLAKSPANRILLPGHGPARSELVEASRNPESAPWLRTHAISERGRQLLRDSHWQMFLVDRRDVLEATVRRCASRLAAWSRSDRPSIAHLLQGLGD